MNLPARDIRYFLYGQNLADGLRITIGILLPALVFSYSDFETGLTLSLGALSVSLVDSPGSFIHKRNAMLLCVLGMAISAIVTGFARTNLWSLGIEVLLFSFAFSMLNVYGPRTASIGTAALLVMILNIDSPLKNTQIWAYTALLATGGLWYMLLSITFYKIVPYRPAQRAIGECIHEMVKFMRIKRDFYDPAIDLEGNYIALVAQQAVVSEKQDMVRELLFKNRPVTRRLSARADELITCFVILVDLYEDISSMYYDYESIRQKLTGTDILQEISASIGDMADTLEAIGLAIQANRPLPAAAKFEDSLTLIKEKTEAWAHDADHTSVVKNIVINLGHLVGHLRQLSQMQPSGQKATHHYDFEKFATHQDYDLRLIGANLNLRSSVFKHSARVAIASVIGFTVSRIIDTGHHSYWILLTILVIMKPSFSLSKKRNGERLLGTLAGGIAGVIILFFIHDKIVLFIILLLFMVLTYSFLRLNYIIMVIFMTPFLLILFKFVGLGPLKLAEERMLDTLIGSAIAFGAGYLLFPNWESKQIKGFMQKAFAANIHFLQKLQLLFEGEHVTLQEYKLVRKEVYISGAGFASAFQRMQAEPRRTRENSKQIQELVVLNHILTSNISAVFSSKVRGERHTANKPYAIATGKALAVMEITMKKIDADYRLPAMQSETGKDKNDPETGQDGRITTRQLAFILKLCRDFEKVAETMNSNPIQL